MIKVVDGNRCNTKTAEKIAIATNIGIYDNGRAIFNGDFYAFTDTLYKRPAGDYFVIGEGGALSEYGSYNKRFRCSCAGKKVFMLYTESQVKDWAEERYDYLWGEDKKAVEEIVGELHKPERKHDCFDDDYFEY